MIWFDEAPSLSLLWEGLLLNTALAETLSVVLLLVVLAWTLVRPWGWLEAVDLREAFDGWFAEFGVPDELTITVRASPSMTSGGCSSAADVADATRQVLPESKSLR